ncbi:MAG TPA: class I SAM-dependent methyltransferase [Candidatus Cloacimonas acidaminovorans]|nr:class I SAM-dependent methyltransferase [Candidatus Cloacimonas acidaminovorans]
MTTWDKIYKNYQKGGEAWATLKEELLPRFVQFVENNKFNNKNALDIGCGTGKYLVYLKELGFDVIGIDSSETAIEMTKEALQNSAELECVNMFDYKIAKDKYDLVFSISTIHHGLKKDVTKLIKDIHDKLVDGGHVFITLPDIESNKKWNTFKSDKEIAPGTYAPISGPEKGLAHSFFAKEEIEEIFSNFKDVKLELDEIGRWYITATK